MTQSDGYDEEPASLSVSHVYRLIELEQIEMEKRVAENRRLNGSRLNNASNVIYLRPFSPNRGASEMEQLPLRRSNG